VAQNKTPAKKDTFMITNKKLPYVLTIDQYILKTDQIGCKFYKLQITNLKPFCHFFKE